MLTKFFDFRKITFGRRMIRSYEMKISAVNYYSGYGVKPVRKQNVPSFSAKEPRYKLAYEINSLYVQYKSMKKQVNDLSKQLNSQKRLIFYTY